MTVQTSTTTIATNPFAAALAEAEKTTGRTLPVRRSVIPTMQAIKLHKNRGDQDILVKFYGTNADITDITPHNTFFDGLQDREAVETVHALFAKAIGRDEKSYTGRERNGLVDTADSKMEKRGALQAGYFFKDLHGAGFRPLQVRVFKKIRSVEEKQRIVKVHGSETYEDQFVLEIRLVHESVWEEKLTAFQSCGMGGLQPKHDFFRALKKLVCPSRWGACTVFSNNTATLDPTVTINFRDQTRGGQPQELALEEGKIVWVPAKE